MNMPVGWDDDDQAELDRIRLEMQENSWGAPRVEWVDRPRVALWFARCMDTQKAPEIAERFRQRAIDLTLETR